MVAREVDKMIKIFPSILSADFARLGDEIKLLETTDADGIHIDVMDGNFVDNITFGMPIISAIRKYSNLFFDVHLMINNPNKYIKAISNSGADGITFHIEAVSDPFETIKLIKAENKKVGISVKPETDLPDKSILKDIDLVLVMAVEPGFGGQKYIEAVNKKIENLLKIRYENDLHFEIQVDGGITRDNIGVVAKCGADIVVAGSAVFGEADRKRAVSELKSLASL